MRRREFMILLGPAAVGWPLAGRAQQPSHVSRVGILSDETRSVAAEFFEPPFVQALQALGYTEGLNIAFERRYAERKYEILPSERSLDLLRWGLVPFWAKDIKVGFANINAKAEGIESKPAFREAFQRRRCLVPVDNFYEWRKTATGKQPYAVALADGRLMALAGLWENWRSPAGEWVRSFAIVTTRPNELCAELHDRMPVVLGPETWPTWLGEEPSDPRQLKALLAPYPLEQMTCWPVSTRVGNVKNNDPSLFDRIADVGR